MPFVQGAVSLAPPASALGRNEAQQFTATVTGAAVTSLTWSISPVVGAISPTGYYTAPDSIGSAETVTVIATSVADPAQFATATVNLSPEVQVSIYPASVTLTAAHIQQFTDIVRGSSNAALTWSASPAVGTTSSAELYPAPASIVAAQTITITAASVADPTKFATALVTLSISEAVAVPTGQYDNGRTSANLNETALNTSNVARSLFSAAQFGKLFTRAVDGDIYAQPLYVPDIHIPGNGVHNVVYVATMHNSVYAFDADDASRSKPLWQVNLGPSVASADYDFDDIAAEVGILSTPVIDLYTNTIYAVANTVENSTYSYWLHALDLITGQEKSGAPVVVTGNLPGSGAGSIDGRIDFTAFQQLQRPALLLSNGVVYIAFGSHADLPPYHGWLFGYSAPNVQQQVAAYIVTPDGSRGSIWQSGRGPAADSSGNIYLETANGDFDGASNLSESVIKLSTAGGLSVTDWFTPDTWAGMNSADDDLGSVAPMLLPGTNALLAAGKQGRVYLMKRDELGHLQTGNTQITQNFQAAPYGIYGMAFWNHSNGPLLFVWAWADYLCSYRMIDGQFLTARSAQNSFRTGFPGGVLALSANGSAPGTGILWATRASTGGGGGPGVLHAFDASDVSRELWNSEQEPARDRLGNFAKFNTPTVANGKVYVGTFSNQLVVYGLFKDGVSVSLLRNPERQ